MNNQSKAQRLADELEQGISLYSACLENPQNHMPRMSNAVDELRRLDALNAELVAVVELARTSHGRMLMSDPPREAWKYNRVDDAIREVLAKAKEQT